MRALSVTLLALLTALLGAFSPVAVVAAPQPLPGISQEHPSADEDDSDDEEDEDEGGGW